MEDEADLTGATPRRRPKADVLAINNKRLKPSTLMMGHGYDPALSEGSLKPPIFLTSTFVFENAAAGKHFFEGVTGKRPGGAEGLIYSRFNGPESGDSRGPARPLGGCGGRARLLLGHVGDRHAAARLRPARRRRRPFGAALRRDRDADRTHPRPLRNHLARFPRRRDRGGDRRRRRARQGAGPRTAHLSGKPGQSDQRAGRCRGGGAGARRTLPRGRAAADRDRQHLSGAALGAAAASGRGPFGLQPDQICRRPLRTSSPAASPARRS